MSIPTGLFTVLGAIGDGTVSSWIDKVAYQPSAFRDMMAVFTLNPSGIGRWEMNLTEPNFGKFSLFPDIGVLPIDGNVIER